MRVLIAAGLAFALLVSCTKTEIAPTIEMLRFPVVMLFSNASVRLCREQRDLMNMHTNYLTLNDEAPSVVDSNFNVYSLDHFKSVHGGLWLMAHPSGTTEVTFQLKRQKSGREIARELFARQLEKQTWRDDVAARKVALASKQTLVEMADVVENGGN